MFSKYRREPLLKGGVFHLYNRGNNGDRTFIYPTNYTYFLDRFMYFLKEDFDLYAYCLLDNHFHLLGRVIGDNASNGFRRLFQSYALSFNKQTGHTGSVFEKTYCRLPVETEAHFRRAIGYINTNPKRHGIMQDYTKYTYSSFNDILSGRSGIVNARFVLEYLGGVKEFLSFIMAYASTLDIQEDPFV